MKFAVIAITKNGTKCAESISDSMAADLYIKERFVTEGLLNRHKGRCFFVGGEFGETVGMLFKAYEGIVFVMAAGIVVRSIAPYIKDKLSDPAVVVIDERGMFSISLLSGHIGGANKLARDVAEAVGAVPVITTATDINEVTAFDELAVRNGCVIENVGDVKYISSELVNGGSVGFYSDLKTKGALKGNIVCGKSGSRFAVVISNRQRTEFQAEKILYLRPKNLVLGIGCKKGKDFSDIKEAVFDFLSKNNRSLLSVRSIASISLKKEERGIREFSSTFKIPFMTYEPEELKSVEQDFEGSEFVRSVTGVGNVCEASAFLESFNGRILCGKTIYDGITLALAEDEKVILL